MNCDYIVKHFVEPIPKTNDISHETKEIVELDIVVDNNELDKRSFARKVPFNYWIGRVIPYEFDRTWSE